MIIKIATQCVCVCVFLSNSVLAPNFIVRQEGKKKKKKRVRITLRTPGLVVKSKSRIQVLCLSAHQHTHAGISCICMQSRSCEKPPGPGLEGDLTVLCDGGYFFFVLLRSTNVIESDVRAEKLYYIDWAASCTN